MTERMHILTKGPLTHPILPGQVFNVNDEFIASLQQNLADKVTDSVPMVQYRSHREDPAYHNGEVTAIVVEGDKVFVEFEPSRDTDLESYAAYPMMSMSYLNRVTGERVGPVLIHVLLRPKMAAVLDEVGDL